MVSHFDGPPLSIEKDEFLYLTEDARVSPEEATHLVGRVYD
ncbi:MAG: hypothetical protein ABEJ81_05175 [Haloferacaceae archaeon]